MSLRDTLEFDKELHSLYETKLPVSASKISSLTKLAIKHAKNYKNIVYSIEKFIQKCPPELKLAGLYTIDSIARAAAKHPEDGKVYIARFEEKLDTFIPHLLQAPPKDKDRVKRTVGLWKRSGLFNVEQVTALEKQYFTEGHAEAPGPTVIASAGLGDPRVSNNSNNGTGIIGTDPRLNNGSIGGPEATSAPQQPAGLPSAGLDATSLLGALGALGQSAVPGLGGNLDVASLLPLLQNQAALPQQPSVQSQQAAIAQLLLAGLPMVSNNPVVGSLTASLQATPSLNSSSGDIADNSITKQHVSAASTSIGQSANPNDFDYGDEEDVKKVTSSGVGTAQSNVTATHQPASFPSGSIRDAVSSTPWGSQSTHAAQHQNPMGQGQTNLGSMGSESSNFPNRAGGGPPQSQQSMLHQYAQHPSLEGRMQNDGKSLAPIGRPIPVVGSDREGAQPVSPWTQAAAQGAVPARPGDCLPGFVDPSLPKEFMKILTRTVYVGGITPNITKENVRDLFETIARVDTVTVNYPKFNAFVKLLTRAEADLVKDRFHKYQYNGTMLKMGWGCGYGPKEFFDYTTGETLFPLARMTDTEKRTISQSTRGGGPIEGGMVVEEPDFGWPQKGDVCKGKYASGQIPFAPGFVAAQQQRDRGGFNQSTPHMARPFVQPGMQQMQQTPWMGNRDGVPAGLQPPFPNMAMGMPRPPHHQYPQMSPSGRGTEIMVVTDRQYDERDDERWRNRQTQDRGEEHIVVLGGGDDTEEVNSTNEAKHTSEDREANGPSDGGGESGQHPRRSYDWPYQHPPPNYGPGYGMPPAGPHGMRPGGGPPPHWGRGPGMYHGGPGARPAWGPPPGWNGPPGGMVPRKRQYSPDTDGRDTRREDDGERQDDRHDHGGDEDDSRRRRSRWE
ncbi:uncharacterized protein SPPG_03038 [Spizellomyces punctatus DAOM BR117]|uniref:CID domain-containing protein n=1 Tax=Spizellomyces punctatus (strain DAOM BR117) TaxID=645134 RepID=A0A0L0HNR9_SPIPD|nr:uncharacterized protein SPPG_03038 [Spizellomyces punctatus DAOM BR117]KND02580.1 hypothetical protein SPPG_03038 [Spizellomyces punctatus DAOM BR117]|eukprot:XP_016610619.1 hypothetical protein SPPG_03038 [Spizellomyces punctatus DAOM BR117]